MDRLKDCGSCRGPTKDDQTSHKEHKDRNHRQHNCRPAPRGDCDSIDTVRVGFFDNRQPFEDNFSGETAGFDISLAWYIFHDLLGYDVEFYQVPVASVGLRILTCGFVDVVASSSVNVIGTADGFARTDLSNYLVTDNGPQLDLAVIFANPPTLPLIACGPNTLRDIWQAIGGLGPDPAVSAFRFATNAPNTVQSNVVRAALTAAYPLTTFTTLQMNTYFTAHTINTSAFTCAQFAQGLVAGNYVALLPGPRGDEVQMTAIYNLLTLAEQAVFTLCFDVAVDVGGTRGWAIRSCKLLLEAQRALDAAISYGVYPSLIRQIQLFPGFDQGCVIEGIGETFLIVPPAKNFSITSGAVSAGCLECLCSKKLREPGCPCAPPLIKLYPVEGSFANPAVYGDCDGIVFTQT